MIQPRGKRPRLLVILGVTAFFYGVNGVGTAWQTARALTGSHDRFVSSMREVGRLVLGVPPDVGTAEDLGRAAERKAEALWSRRGVLIPLAGATGVAAVLLTLGAARAISRGGRRAGWGRQAWQLGALIALPCLGLETLVAIFHSREFIAAIGDLKDPVADQLRALAPLHDRLVLFLGALGALYLAATARYLSSAAAVAYCTDANPAE